MDNATPEQKARHILKRIAENSIREKFARKFTIPSIISFYREKGKLKIKWFKDGIK